MRLGMASVALVLSTLYPEVGNWWYALTLVSPGAWFYYFARGTRQEEVSYFTESIYKLGLASEPDSSFMCDMNI